MFTVGRMGYSGKNEGTLRSKYTAKARTSLVRAFFSLFGDLLKCTNFIMKTFELVVINTMAPMKLRQLNSWLFWFSASFRRRSNLRLH